jgi:hypothetical protein
VALHQFRRLRNRDNNESTFSNVPVDGPLTDLLSNVEKVFLSELLSRRPPASSEYPKFAEGLKALETAEKDLYLDLIFGQ